MNKLARRSLNTLLGISVIMGAFWVAILVVVYMVLLALRVCGVNV